jgi:hypothetical protein
MAVQNITKTEFYSIDNFFQKFLIFLIFAKHSQLYSSRKIDKTCVEKLTNSWNSHELPFSRKTKLVYIGDFLRRKSTFGKIVFSLNILIMGCVYHRPYLNEIIFFIIRILNIKFVLTFYSGFCKDQGTVCS